MMVCEMQRGRVSMLLWVATTMLIFIRTQRHGELDCILMSRFEPTG
jgi:hypothetical protein